MFRTHVLHHYFIVTIQDNYCIVMRPQRNDPKRALSIRGNVKRERFSSTVLLIRLVITFLLIGHGRRRHLRALPWLLC